LFVSSDVSSDGIEVEVFVSSDVASDGIEVGVSDLLKLSRVKDPDTQKRRIENIRRDRKTYSYMSLRIAKII